MKLFKLVMLFCIGSLSFTKVSAQANAYLNILTLNSGYVSQGGTVDIQVTVGNTGPVSSITANKVRAQISVPSALVSLLPNAQQTGLPPGWTITVNTGSAITVCNGSDIIDPGTSRDIFIKVQGNTIGGPSTVNGNLLFSSGTSCTTPGSLSGDNTADNSSTSSIQVYDPIPVTLTYFNAKLINCQPVLNWETQTEINSDRYEIERSDRDNSNWILTGTIAANGNSSSKSEYNFVDKNLNTASEHVFYRLKMVDKDGHNKYSEIVPLFINCKTIGVNAYPNPVQDGRLYINLSGASGHTAITLVSVSGQQILNTSMNNGTNFLNTSSIAAGVYILNITDPNGLDKKIKVFIQH